MAKLPYATTTLANNNNNNEENDTCTHQDDRGTLANPPSPSSGHASSLQVRQQAALQYTKPQGSTTGVDDIPCHPIWHPHQAGCLPDIIEEGIDQQAEVALLPPEVESRDIVTIEPHYLYSWDSYSPHNYSKGDALFNEADQIMN